MKHLLISGVIALIVLIAMTSGCLNSEGQEESQLETEEEYLPVDSSSNEFSQSTFQDLIYPPENEGWEKHVPVIDAPDTVNKSEWFEVTVVVGKDIPHPNIPEHHIEDILVYFKEDGTKPIYKVADFTSLTIHSDSRVTLRVRVENSGTLYALSSCNIHGLWASEKRIEAE